MGGRTDPLFRTIGEIAVIGTMAIYENQAEASEGIPRQWRAFLRSHPALRGSSKLYGASPCTGDGKIHYLTGAEVGAEFVGGGERLILAAGEYAVVRVDDGALLRDTWVWLLRQWLPTSDAGRETRRSLRDSPASRKTGRRPDPWKSGFLSSQSRRD